MLRAGERERERERERDMLRPREGDRESALILVKGKFARASLAERNLTSDSSTSTRLPLGGWPWDLSL